MLSTRWHSLFSLTATTFFIIAIVRLSPVLAGSRPSFTVPHNGHFLQTTTIADNHSIATEQNPSNLLHQLDLTTNQKEQIKKIHHQYKQQISKKRSNLITLQQQLSDLMVGTESAELLRAKNKQLVSLRAEIGKLRFESMLATREVLTPEQRQKFREIIDSQLAQ